MQPLYIHQSNKDAQLKLKTILIDSSPIHLYQPIINHQNEVIAYEMKPAQQLQDLYELGYTRNEYLYELRSVLDAANLIKKHPKNKYIIIVSISPETLDKDDFIESIKNKLDLLITSRIALCMKDGIEKYPGQATYLHNRLIELSGHGFQLVADIQDKSIPLSIFAGHTRFVKVPISQYSQEELSYITKAISSITQENKIKIIFSDILSKDNVNKLMGNEHICFQGDCIGKPQMSLINPCYGII